MGILYKVHEAVHLVMALYSTEMCTCTYMYADMSMYVFIHIYV